MLHVMPPSGEIGVTSLPVYKIHIKSRIIIIIIIIIITQLVTRHKSVTKVTNRRREPEPVSGRTID